jgi:serine/threonine protein kinase
VLISQDGRPVLSDFGVSRLLINSVTIAGTTSLKGAARWMAPELMAPELMSPADTPPTHEFHTKATDVWAFGMVVYVRINITYCECFGLLTVSQEALSGKIPFENCRSEVQVMMSVMSRKLPAKPEDGMGLGKLFGVLWECCCSCWGHNPAERPRMTEVRERLHVSCQ